jgi:5'-deoxynucleotidase YfbR-like HD superfamily hydrolase
VTHLTENPGALHLIARQVVTNTPSETLSELAERIKEQAAKARITYDASAITVALASAQHWHRTHGGLLENHRKQA